MVSSLVRDLYKRLLFAGRDYPEGLAVVRKKAKEAFFKNKDLTDEVSIKKAVAQGRYWVRELRAIAKLHKYRALKKRYEP
jgi:Complex 1 protein (LYR family)